MSRFLPPHVHLDAAYPRPATGLPSNTGWWLQAAYGLDEIWYALEIRGGTGGAVTSTPQLVDATVEPANADDAETGTIRVGEWCYVEIDAVVTLGDDHTGIQLPVLPERTTLPMCIASGSFSGHQLFGRIENGSLMLYTTNGKLNAAAVGSPLSAQRLMIQARYRCQPAPRGRLTDRTHLVTSQG